VPRYIHDADDRVFACPWCDGAGEVYRRTHKHKDFDTTFACHKCGNGFEIPVERPAKSSPGNVPNGGAVEDDDGLPAQLDPDAKELIRQARGS
jgi:predicted RNA-binding Zn-ribbon protein involved in translation (DUF1610 family)